MSKILALTVLSVLTSTTVSAETNVIYGEDNRLEVYEAPSEFQALASSTATMIGAKDIYPDAHQSGILTVKQNTLLEWLTPAKDPYEDLFYSSDLSDELSAPAERSFLEQETFYSESKSTQGFSRSLVCEGTRFVNQPNPGMCSGFLIAPDLLVTAGHCVKIENFCSTFKWVFDFYVDKNTQTAGLDIKEENVYSCKKVVVGALSDFFGMDFGVVQLDRIVKDRKPLEVRSEGLVPSDAQLVVIGAPSGLPTKIAPGAVVRTNSEPFYFTTNLDTFAGNSGSAVFNAKTGVVEGILVRGEDDYELNPFRMCIQAKTCESTGCRGEDVSRMTSIPEVAFQKMLYSSAEAGDVQTLTKILNKKIWVDFYGKDRQSALIKAAAKGQVDTMKLLIAKGADINLQDINGETPAHKAIKAKSASALKTLIDSGANLELPDAQGVSAAQLAKENRFLRGMWVINKAEKKENHIK